MIPDVQAMAEAWQKEYDQQLTQAVEERQAVPNEATGGIPRHGAARRPGQSGRAGVGNDRAAEDRFGDRRQPRTRRGRAHADRQHVGTRSQRGTLLGAHRAIVIRQLSIEPAALQFEERGANPAANWKRSFRALVQPSASCWTCCQETGWTHFGCRWSCDRRQSKPAPCAAGPYGRSDRTTAAPGDCWHCHRESAFGVPAASASGSAGDGLSASRGVRSAGTF